MSENASRGVAMGRIDQPAKPSAEHKQMELFIGKWINEGHTVAAEGAPSMKILTSDVYEWMPGGFLVIHSAYGLIDKMGGGGMEIMGYDAAKKRHMSYFFDSQGNISTHEITIDDNTCKWQGERTRCTAIFTNNGNTQTAHHERLDENGKWVPSMEVVLTRVK